MNIFSGFNLGKIAIGLAFILSQFPMVANAKVDPNIATEILVYINQYRVQNGLSRLVMSETLSTEANQHSVDMAKHLVPFGHDGFSTRIAHLHKKIPNSLSGAENVAYNYKTAQIVAAGWIKSSGHRKNIRGNYNLTGIGIAEDTQGKLYYTQIFLRSGDAKGNIKQTRIKSFNSFFMFG